MSRNSGFHALNSLVERCMPGEWGSDPIGDSSNCVVYRATDIDNDGHLTLDGGAERVVLSKKIDAKALKPNDIVLEASGGAPDKPVGRVALFKGPSRKPALVSNFFRFLRPKLDVDGQFLTFQLVALNRSSAIWRYQQQTTGLINLKVVDYLKHPVWVPTLAAQKKIATILTSLDTAIEKTEALIEKHQQIKAGLMHDLFTRGVLPNGQLRPPREQAPELYRETAIGWIPKEWEACKAGDITQSIVPGRDKPAIDGGGVPWITTSDLDKFYISKSNAGLSVSARAVAMAGGRVIPKGAVILSCVGEFGVASITACELTMNQQLHAFLPKQGLLAEWLAYCVHRQKHYMERVATQTTIRYLNKAGCESIPVCLPQMPEQVLLCERLGGIAEVVHADLSTLRNLRHQKLGLMQDLLTGKVPVKIADPEAVPA
jgi:type I restriction enzyme S subunit